VNRSQSTLIKGQIRTRHEKGQGGAGRWGTGLAESTEAGSEAKKCGEGGRGGGATAPSQVQRAESMSPPSRKAAGGPLGAWSTPAPFL